MSLIPAFEIGVWNAWILTIFIFLYVLLSVQIFKDVGKKIAHGEEEKKFSTFVSLFFFILLIYSIFLPLKLGTVWLYVGLPIVALALVMTIMATMNFATTPLDEPVTRGVYRISRHPIYLSGFLLYVGIGIACASWVVLLCAVLWIVLWYIVVPSEERFLLEKYGDAYREYMNRTPRWIGIPKS